jgi:tetratricopeptide (TPR) repeat protein
MTDLWQQYRKTRSNGDLSLFLNSVEKVVGLMPEDHPEYSEVHRMWCAGLVDKFATGEQKLEDVEKAVILGNIAVACERPDDINPAKAEHHNAFARALLTHFDCTGNLTDLENAISSWHTALELIPEEHPDRESYISSLGRGLLARFERLGSLEDLDQAVSAHHTSADLAPHNTAGLQNLGNALRARFARLGDTKDLDQAIVAHRTAAEHISSDDPHLPEHLNDFAIALATRGNMKDLDEAISTLQTAAEIISPGHRYRPGLLTKISELCCFPGSEN